MFSLKTPWWLYWNSRKDKQKKLGRLLASVYREKCAERLADWLQRRGLSDREFRDRMRWEDEKKLQRLRNYEFDGDGGLPPMYLRTMAATLGVPSQELEPSDREHLVEATLRLCRDLIGARKISRSDAEAYVEYLLQWPTFYPGRLDSEAAERAFQALPGRFDDPTALADAIKLTARTIDAFLVFLF
jgi:hypothetical protein